MSRKRSQSPWKPKASAISSVVLKNEDSKVKGKGKDHQPSGVVELNTGACPKGHVMTNPNRYGVSKILRISRGSLCRGATL